MLWKKKRLLVIVFAGVLTLSSLFSSWAAAPESSEKHHQIQKEMRSKPDLITPDSIYLGSGLDAIYWQNIQMINLLKDIKDLLREQIEIKTEKEKKEKK